MGKLIDLTGKRFGRWRVLEKVDRKGRGCARWICECDCGTVAVVPSGNLTKGLSTGCVCSRTKHGLSTSLVREYTAWRAMRLRCNNPSHPAYHNYGGRGITVCERWDDFALFAQDMGLCPDGHSLERKDNDKGYEPDNCVWATRVEQGQNRRTSKVTEAMAEAVRASDEHQLVLADRYGISQATVSRIKNNVVWKK